MRRLHGGQAVVESLKLEGVTHVFGLIGSAGMEIFDALYDVDKIQFVGVRDERTGIHMADGYARASGRAGVFIAGQNGPGATNMTTGIAQAYAAFSPVVALTGHLSTGHIYRDAFQEVDQQALFSPITKSTWTLSQAERTPEMVRQAFRVALADRMGPVVLNLPRDLMASTEEFSKSDAPVADAAISMPTATPAALSVAADMLANAKRPLIIAGGGVKNTDCHQGLLLLAERLAAPIVMSPGHGDAISCNHPLYGGQVGPRGNQVASQLAREADVILALGTRLGFNTTFYTNDNLNKNAKIIQVEIEPTAIGRFFPVELGIYGHAVPVVEGIDAQLEDHHPNEHVLQWRDRFIKARSAMLRERDAQVANPSAPISPYWLFKVLRDVMPQDVVYTLDAGTLCLQATDQLNYYQPRALFTPLDFGLVGFSYACGLGAKLARPERTVVSLMGDGGFGMACSEISTAVQHGINTICIVMNNGSWGAEKAYQRDFFSGRYIGADIVNPPYDELARIWGAKGFSVDQPDQLENTLLEALQCDAPVVIDVKIDPDALYSFRRDSFKHRASQSQEPKA